MFRRRCNKVMHAWYKRDRKCIERRRLGDGNNRAMIITQVELQRITIFRDLYSVDFPVVGHPCIVIYNAECTCGYGFSSSCGRRRGRFDMAMHVWYKWKVKLSKTSNNNNVQGTLIALIFLLLGIHASWICGTCTWVDLHRAL